MSFILRYSSRLLLFPPQSFAYDVFSRFHQLCFLQELLGWPGIFFAKLSILLLYRRIFAITPLTKRLIYIGIAWAFVAYIPCIVITLYYCIPRTGESWRDIGVPERCTGQPIVLWTVSGVMDLMLDIYLVVLPVPKVMGLNLGRGKKWGVLSVFLAVAL